MLATVVIALAFVLLTFSAWWVPVSVELDGAVHTAAGPDVETVRRLLRDGVEDERGTWTCPNSSDCALTPSLLATTTAARRSVYSRTGIDCLAMFRGHANEMEAARSLTDRQHSGSTTTDEDLRVLAADCAAFRRSRGYFTQPLSQREADFPIAFSILVYDNIPQVSIIILKFGGQAVHLARGMA